MGAQSVTEHSQTLATDKRHPGSRVMRIRNTTIDRIATRAGRKRGQSWSDELNEVVNAGLIALGEAPLFPEEPTPS